MKYIVTLRYVDEVEVEAVNSFKAVEKALEVCEGVPDLDSTEIRRISAKEVQR